MTDDSKANVAGVVLAAGGSSRLGEPKQLVEVHGTSLVRRATEAAIAAGCNPVVVVVGHAADAVRDELRGLAVGVVHNAAWEAGMGGSIGAGVGMVEEADVDGVLVTLCDQPGVSAPVLKRLIQSWTSSSQPIAAAGYAGGPGVPAVFSRSLFAALLSLDDRGGAKPLLRERADRVLIVPMPEAELDVDTAADVAVARRMPRV